MKLACPISVSEKLLGQGDISDSNLNYGSSQIHDDEDVTSKGPNSFKVLEADETQNEVNDPNPCYQEQMAEYRN